MAASMPERSFASSRKKSKLVFRYRSDCFFAIALNEEPICRLGFTFSDKIINFYSCPTGDSKCTCNSICMLMLEKCYKCCLHRLKKKTLSCGVISQ